MNESTLHSHERERGNAHRVLLLGASGRLGAAISTAVESVAKHATAIELLTPSRHALGLDDSKPMAAAQRWLEAWRPDVVVNCIAMSDVDRCEREPIAAMRMNADLPGALAAAAARHGAHLIHFSTDFIFDGGLRRPYREDDRTAPLSVYGESKLAGEKAIASENASHWIFRVSWLYGGSARNLAATLLDPANAGRMIALAADRVGVPNPVQLLAGEIVQAIASLESPQPPACGVYHLSCHGHTTWHEFGGEFVARAIDAGLIASECAPRIEKMDEGAMNRPARRPAWSVLDPSRYESAFGRLLPDWRAAIALAMRRGE